MAATPLSLQVGMAAIYGIGYEGITAQGVKPPAGFKIGSIYQIWDGGENYIYSGQAIFKEGDQYCRIVTSNNLTYTIIEYAKLAVEPTVALP
jgi:hypothetical protein